MCVKHIIQLSEKYVTIIDNTILLHYNNGNLLIDSEKENAQFNVTQI